MSNIKILELTKNGHGSNQGNTLHQTPKPQQASREGKITMKLVNRMIPAILGGLTVLSVGLASSAPAFAKITNTEDGT